LLVQKLNGGDSSVTYAVNEFFSSTSDYNNFYTTNLYLATAEGNLYVNLSDFRSGTGLDLHSKENAVSFVSDTDLHLAGASANDTSLTGIPVSEVIDDIDGQPRDGLRPYIGADEISVSIRVNLKFFIEGFFDEASNMQVPDTVRVYLRNTLSPYNITDSASEIIDSNGEGLFRFENAPGGTYYIVVKHRNSIETWSKNGGEILTAGQYSAYDFTNSITQAYGNNLILKGSKYCIYSGDVNQDGVVDGTDTQLIDNDAYNFANGYVNTDTDGNSFVDGSDAIISDNNAFNFVSVIRP